MSEDNIRLSLYLNYIDALLTHNSGEQIIIECLPKNVGYKYLKEFCQENQLSKIVYFSDSDLLYYQKPTSKLLGMVLDVPRQLIIDLKSPELINEMLTTKETINIPMYTLKKIFNQYEFENKRWLYFLFDGCYTDIVWGLHGQKLNYADYLLRE